jgi:hypothetical protein
MRRRFGGAGCGIEQLPPGHPTAHAERRMRRWWLWVVLLGSFAGVGCARTAHQPIAFNHRLHVYNNVPCTVCHASAATGQGAGLPGVAVCRRCHENVLYEPAEQAKIRVAVASGQDLRWLPVFALKPFVYFSLRRHVTLGKLECRACHGEVEMQSVPFEPGPRPFGGRQGMAACISCHETSHSAYAGVDCVNCHR